MATGLPRPIVDVEPTAMLPVLVQLPYRVSVESLAAVIVPLLVQLPYRVTLSASSLMSRRSARCPDRKVHTDLLYAGLDQLLHRKR
jgi:hypothetical protein